MLVGSHDAGAYRPYGGPGDDNLVTSATFAQVREYIFAPVLLLYRSESTS